MVADGSPWTCPPVTTVSTALYPTQALVSGTWRRACSNRSRFADRHAAAAKRSRRSSAACPWVSALLEFTTTRGSPRRRVGGRPRPHRGAQLRVRSGPLPNCALARRLPHRRWARAEMCRTALLLGAPLGTGCALSRRPTCWRRETVCGKTYTQATEQAGGS